MSSTATLTDGARRRYSALRAREKDQRGTPEGDLCKSMADRMLEVTPGLADSDSEYAEVVGRYSYKNEHEERLIIRIGRFLDAGDVLVRVGSRARALFFETDAATHAAIEQAFSVLAPRMNRLLDVTWVGFVSGCLPIASGTPIEYQDDEDDMEDAALAAMNFGRSSEVRKAIARGDS